VGAGLLRGMVQADEKGRDAIILDHSAPCHSRVFFMKINYLRAFLGGCERPDRCV